MPKTAAQVLKDAMELPESQRLELAWGLLDSVEGGPPGSDKSDEDWIAEIERRVQAVLDGEPGIPWEDAKAEIYRHLGRA